MSTFLLDVNVLIALIDPMHVHHEVAHAWFKATGRRNWASCPLTENGVIRIVSHAKYPNCIGSPGLAADVMARFCALPGHVFWPDDISVLNSKHIDTSRLLGSSQITDSYLLALARAHGGKLATFDNRLVVDAVRGGARGVAFDFVKTAWVGRHLARFSTYKCPVILANAGADPIYRSMPLVKSHVEIFKGARLPVCVPYRLPHFIGQPP